MVDVFVERGASNSFAHIMGWEFENGMGNCDQEFLQPSNILDLLLLRLLEHSLVPVDHNVGSALFKLVIVINIVRYNLRLDAHQLIIILSRAEHLRVLGLPSGCFDQIDSKGVRRIRETQGVHPALSMKISAYHDVARIVVLPKAFIAVLL